MAIVAARLRRAVSVAISGVLLVALVGCSGAAVPSGRSTVIDLVQQDWRNVPGVDADGSSLKVAATGRRIVEQDGGEGRSDPPVDLAGTHLVAAGDFTLSASFANVTADATLAVSVSPPVIADEFRIEPAGVRLTLRGKALDIAVFDGSTDQDVTDPRPVYGKRVTLRDPRATIVTKRSGDLLTIASGSQALASLPVADAFDSGRLWLGLSSEAGSFTVTSLTATAPAGTPLAAAGPVGASAKRSPNGLQALADRSRPGFLIGAAAALGPLAADTDYAENLIGEFGALTPENAMKPQALSPRQGEYTFAEADALLDLAKSKGMAVHGHTIACTEAMPRWMRDLPTGTKQARDASAKVLLDYVSTVVTHFKGRLNSLDVVNEPLDVDQGTSLQKNIWYRVFGASYPVTVSRAVHAADPDVKQFINENGADVPGPRQDALLRLALDTNKRGGHIDGVGLQAHVYDLDTDAVSSADLASTFTTFGRAGLVVRISENDVVDDGGEDVQAQQYATILRACLRSRTCVSYTTWGVDDRYDWFIDNDGALQQGHDFLFDDGDPTPAYDAVRAVLAR
ncbi:endo-1,4-beta-xylanase [Rathayibacter sp. VKM Ac-2801]|uniref:endo-1,4-beta-xylanase n=1 Tax=Rathayibacter sp. VKM Ac-2801 TaxID=2609255 RepID=UPI00131FF77B|nr:endo-1,4-beta-xylanase [Rathayibacter sp. VKM Ac-2801]QHC69328.1 glycoside hydrolase [Rathayibacter sp. VKM Ac-2801]